MTAYQATLASWLRQRWVEHSGKPNSPTFDVETLIRKLQSALVLDRWLVSQVRMATERPAVVDRRHVELVAALVRTLTLEGGE